VTDSALLIGNQGVPFDAPRIGALLRLGGSSKERTSNHHTIGYKGIGFSSVFEVTDEPQIISADVQFCFHRGAAKQRVQQHLRLSSRKAPIRRFPFPLEPKDWEQDAAAVHEMLDRGAITVVRLPLRSEFTASRVNRDVRTSLPPEVLLFMPALDGLTFLGDEGQEWRRRTQTKKGLGHIHHLDGQHPRSWLTVSTSVSIQPELSEALGDDLWVGVKQVGAAVAVPWSRGRPDPERGAQSLHVYFPTEDGLGRPLLVHGDFYVDSSRRHIEHLGAGGAVSERVAVATAGLVAQIAEKLVAHGNDLLRCLGPVADQSPDGYGKHVADLIDARLRDARICRPLRDKGATSPGSLKRLGTQLDVAMEKRLAALVQPQSDLMHVGDDLDVEEWLTQLGCEELKSADLAARLEPARSNLSYDKAVEVVAAWYDTVSSNWRVKSVLQSRPLVQDSSGRWRHRDQVVIPDGRTPLLPAQLRPRVYAPPRNRRAKSFHERVMDVPEMTPERALDLLLDAVDAGEFATTDAERMAALEFVFKLWKAHPRAIERTAGRLASIPVPVRKTSARKRGSWRPAGTTYFSHRERQDAVAERIYGVLGEEEFLVMEASWSDSLSDWLTFFEKVGVAVEPRAIDIAALGWKDTYRWAAAEEVQSARRCPDGHPQSGYSVVGKSIDRLSQLLDSGHRSSLSVLAGYLVDTGRPFGRGVEVKCGHSAHRGSRGRRVIGLQEWLLREHAWIPVIDPSGNEGFRPIDEAWYDVPAGVLDTIVPRAELPDSVCAALGLVSAGRPSRRALEATLHDLEAANPDLSMAPAAIVAAADWLSRKLDALGPATEVGAAPPLSAWTGEARVWSNSPVIPDVPGVEHLPIERLALGEWSGLRASYGLALASDRVEVRVRPEPPVGVPALRLTPAAREQMVAVLHARGADLPLVARRLGLLREVPCSTVVLELSVDGGEPVVARRPYHLEEDRDRRRRRVGRLYLAENFGPEDFQPIARLLTRYADVEHLAESVTLVLAMGDSFLISVGIGDAALSEAREALARYPRAAELTEVDQEPQTDTQMRDEAAESATDANDDGAEASASVDGIALDGELEDDEGDMDWSDAWPDTGGAQGEGSKPSSSPETRLPGSGGAEPGRGGPGRFRGLHREEAEQEPIDPERLAFTRVSCSPGNAPTTRRPVERGEGDDGDEQAGEAPATRVLGADRDATEQNAIAVFTRFAESELNARVKRVDRFNFGWDLELSIGGQRILVEVKGFGGESAGFIITRKELRAAKAEADYRVAIVTGLRSGAGTIVMIPAFGSAVDEAQLEPMSWQVADWESLPHESHTWFETT
jgi:hypothetical protein